jgi:uncharacterized membrane protein
MPRALRSLILAIILTSLPGALAPAAAQTGLTITTPYPAVSVQPGATLNMVLTVEVDRSARVALNLQGLPDRWEASLSGGGNEVQAVFVKPETPVEVTLSIDVPQGARGPHSIAVVGTAGGEKARLPLQLRVANVVGGAASLESDYPSLRGPADEDFQFNLTLSNDTPQQLTYALQAEGPRGWSVTIQPTGETNAASVTVDARGEQRLEVTASPPADAAAGEYPIRVLVAAGEHRATADLTVEVTGRVAMEFSTPDQRLNTTANAGSTRDLQVVVANSGTSLLHNVQLAGSGPSEWEISFEPETIGEIPPGQSATATAHITPAGSAVAGDYSITFTASTEGAPTESLDIRVTVETPPIWGLVGIALIVATLAGLVWVFRRFGRR